MVADFERSSLKQREFCDARGVDFFRFRYWLYQLRREQREQSSPRFVPLVSVRYSVSVQPKTSGAPAAWRAHFQCEETAA